VLADGGVSAVGQGASAAVAEPRDVKHIAAEVLSLGSVRGTMWDGEEGGNRRGGRRCRGGGEGGIEGEGEGTEGNG